MDTPPTESKPIPRWLPAVGLVLLVLFSYAPAFTAGFIWDDDEYVTQNQNLVDATGLMRIWLEPQSIPQYYPLVHTTYWLEYQVWGLSAPGYHTTNILLHALVSLLLWRCLARLKVPGAWVVAAFFAVHPMNVQSVAWITERKNVLCGLFFFASLLVMIDWLRLVQGGSEAHSDEEAQPSTGNWRETRLGYAAALTLFVFAMFSKTIACCLPVVLVLLLWWKRGRLERRSIIGLVPFFVVGLVMGLNTVYLERTHVGAVGQEWQFEPLQRVLLAGRALWFYAAKLVAPGELMFIYPRWQLDTSNLFGWVFPIGWLALLGVLWFKRDRIGRGPAVGMLCFSAALFPALGFFNIYWHRYYFVADHMVYLAAAALLAVVIGSIAFQLRRHAMADHAAVRLLTAVALILTSCYTAVHTLPFRDIELLWQDTLAKNPDAWLASNNLAVIHRNRGDFDGARSLLETAVERDPTALEPLLNLGQLWLDLGQPQPAVRYFTAAVDAHPQSMRAHAGLAESFESLGQSAAANRAWASALAASQGQEHGPALLIRGKALAALDRPGEALDAFAATAASQPRFAAEAYRRMAAIQVEQGRDAEAVILYQQALERLEPAAAAETLSQLARLLATSRAPRVRDTAKAVELATLAVEVTGRRAPRYFETLSIALEADGNLPQAVSAATAGLALAQQAGFDALADRMRHRRVRLQKLVLDQQAQPSEKTVP